LLLSRAKTGDGTGGVTDDQFRGADTFADSLDWQIEDLAIGATRNWAKSAVTWNVALDPSGGPSMNCTTCTAAVTVNNSSGTAAG
jgi:glucosylceramidase